MIPEDSLRLFQWYFQVADECWGDDDDALTLDDLEPDFVACAEMAAQEHGLPWPPYLPAAEEWALDHRDDLLALNARDEAECRAFMHGEPQEDPCR